MKGPYERLKYDLRRLWECQSCHRRERSEGSVTFLLCECETKSGGRPVPMKLLEEAGHRTVPPFVPPVSEELLTAPAPAIEAPGDEGGAHAESNSPEPPAEA